MSETTRSSEGTGSTVNVPAGVLALVLPGAGHFYLGERKRAVLIAAGVLGLFFGGMLIGGIDVVDSRESRVWFFGQALVGPLAFGVDRVHQSRFKAYGIGLVEGDTGPTFRVEEASLERLVPRSLGPAERRAMVRGQVVRDGRSVREVELPLAVPADMGAGMGAGEGPPKRRSLAKVHEIGTLYGTIAGMMNFIVILDALVPGRVRRKDEEAGA